MNLRYVARYDRDLLASVMTYHQRRDAGSCDCGWSELGESHIAHVLDVYDQAAGNTCTQLLAELDRR